VSRFTGKVAFITGAGAEAERGGFRDAGAEGAHVVLAELDESTGRATEAECRVLGIDATFVHTDVTDLATVEHAVSVALERTGRIDVLVNCAGGSLPADAPVTTVDLALWEPTMDTNVLGTIHCCRAALPHMGGAAAAVVNMTSICAIKGNHPMHLYAAAKGAIISLTRALAGQYWRDGIRVNCIAPGTVLTERVAARWDPDDTWGMGFDTHPYAVGQPADMAAIIAFLASDDSRMITGAMIPAEGGLTFY
jgi:NAD(P)-dependent dehydrogenase (short-subunit alcohol dehydrogenase family)